MKDDSKYFKGVGKYKKECPDCKALRKGTTWIGKPPKCSRHRNIRTKKYYGGNIK